MICFTVFKILVVVSVVFKIQKLKKEKLNF